MATMQSWRKAYGAIKDQTKVGLAQINSDYKDLDIAIVKATNHVECPPKERHLRKIMIATSAVRPRADVAYCIIALARRLGKTRNWTVALKTLIVQDPFAMSNNIAPPAAVQMAAMAQQPQFNPFGPYQPPYQPQPLPQQPLPQPLPQQPLPHQPLTMAPPPNPFGETGFTAFPVDPVPHPQSNNPFGSTGLL
ncbi:hypothetical protein Droror1_Dr00009248 [Drosera rotundifolia]